MTFMTTRCKLFSGAMFLAAFIGVGLPASGQETISRGFATPLRATATGEELGNQPNLWILEVRFKSMRLVPVEITDPKTGEKKKELVWYLCYKAINRPLGKKSDASDLTPVNDDDPPPSKPIFVPEFTLVTDDNGVQKEYHDVIIPEAQTALLKRENRRPGDKRYKNSVEAVGPIPDATDADDPAGQTIWGVAMFRGVDPDTDFFSVYMTGFSNGYRATKGPDGEPLILRRTIRQDFWRPGDRFAQQEQEFRLKGEPVWEYRPDDVKGAAEPVNGAPPDKAAEAPAAGNAEKKEE